MDQGRVLQVHHYMVHFDSHLRNGQLYFRRTGHISYRHYHCDMSKLTPYKEQHDPWGQSPQTVFPFPAPHVPSVVSCPLAGAADGGPRTGS